jgi:hypothetical protein
MLALILIEDKDALVWQCSENASVEYTTKLQYDKHTIVDLFCLKWTSQFVSGISGFAFNVRLLEKSILSKQINDGIYIEINTWHVVLKKVSPSLLKTQTYIL